MEVHYHFAGEKVFHEEIEMNFIRTNLQVVDIFTKGHIEIPRGISKIVGHHKQY